MHARNSRLQVAPACRWARWRPSPDQRATTRPGRSAGAHRCHCRSRGPPSGPPEPFPVAGRSSAWCVRGVAPTRARCRGQPQPRPSRSGSLLHHGITVPAWLSRHAVAAQLHHSPPPRQNWKQRGPKEACPSPPLPCPQQQSSAPLQPVQRIIFSQHRRRTSTADPAMPDHHAADPNHASASKAGGGALPPKQPEPARAAAARCPGRRSSSSSSSSSSSFRATSGRRYFH